MLLLLHSVLSKSKTRVLVKTGIQSLMHSPRQSEVFPLSGGFRLEGRTCPAPYPSRDALLLGTVQRILPSATLVTSE